jgi:hypothetical protein
MIIIGTPDDGEINEIFDASLATSSSAMLGVLCTSSLRATSTGSPERA